jgi:hypothetical protein
MTPAVRETIIEPMVELYLPPQHLRGDREAQARALEVYGQALDPFDRETLTRAWRQVVAGHAFWVWPNPGLLAEACRQCEPRPRPPSDEAQRQAQAMELAETYTARYLKTSQLARLARREGWAASLREYVCDAAWVQAQLLCRVQNMGWNARLAKDLGPFRSSEEAFEAYRRTIGNPVERGYIRVHVPPSRIRRWKEDVALDAMAVIHNNGQVVEEELDGPRNPLNFPGTPEQAR